MSDNYQDEDFMMAEAIKEFTTVVHNPIDHDSFNDFNATLNKRYDGFTKEKALQERRKSLSKWDEQLVSPWNQARLSTIRDTKAAIQAARIIKEKKWGSFFITGEPSSGKTFLALAIARRYVGGGMVQPSQVKHISESRLLTSLRGGFKGQEIVNEIFSPKYRLYVIDNVGLNATYEARESSMWELLLDHIVMNGYAIIFTSSSSLRSFTERLSGPAQAKIVHMVHDRTITMSSVVAQPDAGDITQEEARVEEEVIETKETFDTFVTSGKGIALEPDTPKKGPARKTTTRKSAAPKKT